ncbi:hypothetical protein NBRC116589_18950 [Ruegeria sp. HU-ET01832]
MKIYRLEDWESHGSYDYRDHWTTDTMFIRIKDICIYVSFTDAAAVNHMTQRKFERVPSSLNFIQSIEIFGDFVAAKLHFNQQHNFRSIYFPEKDCLLIKAEIANDFDWHDLDPGIRGSAQVFAFTPDFGKFTISGLDHEATFNEIASGERTFFPEGENGGLSLVEQTPPVDPDYAKRLSDEAADRAGVQDAFRRMTKGFFEGE